jgi:hypothetical protein
MRLNKPQPTSRGLRRDGAGLRIVQKRVDLINRDSAFEAMAVPI